MIIYTTDAGYLTEPTQEELQKGEITATLEVVEQLMEDASIVCIAARKWRVSHIEARKQLVKLLESES